MRGKKPARIKSDSFKNQQKQMQKQKERAENKLGIVSTL